MHETHPNPPSDLLFSGLRYQDHAGGPFRTALAHANPQSGQASMLECHFFPHGWAIDPHEPQRVLFFEKYGPGAGVFDLNQLQLIQRIEPVGNREFYGHGVIANDGQRLLTTEADPQGQGWIGIRDAHTLAYLGDFPSYGARPHDCCLTDDGQTLMVSNAGGTATDGDNAPCISYINIASQQLISRHTMPGQQLNTGHLTATSPQTAFVVSAPRFGMDASHEGGVSWCSRGLDSLSPCNFPAQLQPRLVGEALSVVMIPAWDLVAVSHPSAGWLTFWQVGQHQLVLALPMDNVRGLAVGTDGNSLWISHGLQPHLSRMHWQQGQPCVQQIVDQALLGGSHLLNHPKAWS